MRRGVQYLGVEEEVVMPGELMLLHQSSVPARPICEWLEGDTVMIRGE